MKMRLLLGAAIGIPLLLVLQTQPWRMGWLIAALSPVIPHVFSNDPAVQSRITAALLVLAVMQFPGAIAFAMDGALIGAHDMAWLGRQAIRNLVAFAPLAIATVIWPRLGLAGIWGAQMCWMIMRAGVNWRRWGRLAAHQFTGVADAAVATA